MIDVQQMYAEHEALVAKEPPVACARGCNKCCNQLVPATAAEGALIDAHLEANNLRSHVAARGADLLGEWLEYRTANLDALRKNGIKAFQDWLGKRCIYLNDDGACDVYEARPMNCRTITSTVPCVSHYQPEAKRFRYGFERPMMEKIWASGPSMSLLDLFIGVRA